VICSLPIGPPSFATGAAGARLRRSVHRSAHAPGPAAVFVGDPAARRERVDDRRVRRTNIDVLSGDAAMSEQSIMVTSLDARRLQNLLARQSDASIRDETHLQQLQGELERAAVFQWDETPKDVVTMHSEVRVFDLESGERNTYTLVFPAEADIAAKRISVLAPLGTALLGFREGDVVEWIMPGGERRLRIERVRQPERPAAEIRAAP
jgi:regulator of nucleoside diphosphate kinase